MSDIERPKEILSGDRKDSSEQLDREIQGLANAIQILKSSENAALYLSRTLISELESALSKLRRVKENALISDEKNNKERSRL